MTLRETLRASAATREPSRSAGDVRAPNKADVKAGRRGNAHDVLLRDAVGACGVDGEDGAGRQGPDQDSPRDGPESTQRSGDPYAVVGRSSTGPPSTSTSGHMTSAGFYSRAHVLAMLPISNTTLWRLVRAGSFPQPVALSPGRVAWPKNAVDKWIAARTPAAEATEVA
jgi:predicted DNA-binding transcriptional regulator AlpA